MTSRWPTNQEFEDLSATVEEFFMDTCKIRTHSETQGHDGELTSSYTTGSAIPCRWSPVRSAESSAGSVVFSESQWKLTLPKGTAIDHLDHVELTHRMGKELSTHIDAGVDGDFQTIVGAIQVNLKILET
jgi:hypothetical protein